METTEDTTTLDQETTSKLKEGLMNVEEKAARLGQKATEKMDNIKTRAVVYQQTTGEFIDALAEYIKQNPQRSALVAGATGVGLGIIVGLLLRRKD